MGIQVLCDLGSDCADCGPYKFNGSGLDSAFVADSPVKRLASQQVHRPVSLIPCVLRPAWFDVRWCAIWWRVSPSLRICRACTSSAPMAQCEVIASCGSIQNPHDLVDLPKFTNSCNYLNMSVVFPSPSSLSFPSISMRPVCCIHASGISLSTPPSFLATPLLLRFHCLTARQIIMQSLRTQVDIRVRATSTQPSFLMAFTDPLLDMDMSGQMASIGAIQMGLAQVRSASPSCTRPPAHVLLLSFQTSCGFRTWRAQYLPRAECTMIRN